MVLELILFTVFVVLVIGLGIFKGQKEEGGSDSGAGHYFLAGRGLTWYLVGFSLIAANISTEQFVGMSGQAADWLGMAIASYEWMAGITLVVVAFIFLPKFLKCGIYTAPEFLEYRYGPFSRFVMAIATLVILVGVPTASVIFSGAKVVSVYYPDVPILGSLTASCWLIAIVAAAYVFIGGLKACAWTDLIWGASLILGGGIVAYLVFQNLAGADPSELAKTATNKALDPNTLKDAGAWERFQLLNAGTAEEGGKLHMRRPIDDESIPWTALMLGLWIPNFFYWGLNQYIIQRTLGSKSLAEGQKGIVFAAFLKLLIPFVVVIPGILAFNLFSGDLHLSAAESNIRALKDATAKQTVLIDHQVVELQPGIVADAIARNAGLAGVASDLPADADSMAIAEHINGLAKLAAEKDPKVTQGPRLVSYDYDAAFPVLLKNLIKPHWYISWFVLAAIFGAVVSSLASMLNSASTIATMDIYRKFNPNASQEQLIKSGRFCVVLFVIIAAIIAPFLANPGFGGIFTFIQEFQGFISPGVLAVFLFGALVPKAPRFLGWSGILMNMGLYGLLKIWLGDVITENGLWFSDNISFLDRMAVCFIVVMLYCTIMTIVKPLPEPAILPVNKDMNLESSKFAKIAGAGVVCLTIILYIIFW